MVREIPKEDVKLVNDAFRQGQGQNIIKDANGKIISSGNKLFNEKVSATVNFRGRILKHDYHLIPKGGKQILIGKKGQSFDDIPVSQRDQVFFSESDFE